MSQTDNSDDLEAQIRAALARRRDQPAGRPPAGQSDGSGLAADPADRLERPKPRVRFVIQDPQKQSGSPPQAGIGHPAPTQPAVQRPSSQPPTQQAGSPPAPARPAQPPVQPASPASPSSASSSAALPLSAPPDDETETRIPPPPGAAPPEAAKVPSAAAATTTITPGKSETAAEVLGRIGVEQKEAPKQKEKPFRHPFFTGKRHLWPLLILPVASLGGILTLFWFLNFELAGEGVVDIAPLIEAPEGPIKVRPTEEGGMAIPNQDKEIFKDLAGDNAASGEVEQLVPPPEEPVVPAPPKPTAIATESETGTVATVDNSLPSVAAPDPATTADPAAQDELAVSTEAEAVPAAGESAAVEPAAEPAAEEPAPEPIPITQTAVLPPGAFRVQLAALRSEEGARGAWAELQKKFPDLLGDLDLFIERIDLGGEKGVFYRVQGGPIDDGVGASRLCGSLSARGQDCLVVKP